MNTPMTVRRSPPAPEPTLWPAPVPASILVAIDIKVVASGIVMEKQAGGPPRRKLRASLVLSPKAKTDTAGELQVDLTKWPKEIEQNLLAKPEHMAIAVSCLPESFDAASRRPGPDNAHRNRKLTIKRRAGNTDQIDALTSCWQQIMGASSPANPHPWVGLKAVFTEASHPPANTRNDQAKDILGVPRADMALFLQAWRARVVLGGVFKDKKAVIEPGCDPVADLHQWILSDPDLKFLAGDTAAPAHPLDSGTIRQIKAAIVRQFDKRKEYLDLSNNADNALKLLDAFRCEGNPCQFSLDVLEPIATENESAIHAMFQTHRSLHEAQLALEDSLKSQIDSANPADAIKWDLPTAPDALAVQIAKTRLYGVQAIPALARVFRLVVDIEAELGDLDVVHRSDAPPAAVVAGQPNFESLAAVLSTLAPAKIYEFDTVDSDAGTDPIPSTDQTLPVTHYLYLTSAADGTRQPWTTAKLRYPTGPAWSGVTADVRGRQSALVEGHFFPCTREEIDIASTIFKPRRQSAEAVQTAGRAGQDGRGNATTRFILPAVKDGRIVQFDGVLDLGAGRRAKKPSERRPRYDMLSLDVVSAMESQINLARAESTRRKERRERKVDDRPTYRTLGLTLVDRWSAAAAAEAAADIVARRTERAAAGALFDATALTVGYRIDVGVRSARVPKAGSRQKKLHDFRALGNRIVRYTYPGSPNLIERELEHLGYGMGTNRQARIRIDSTPVVPGARRTDDHRFPEEQLVSWEGDPLGLQCVRTWDGKDVEILVDPAEELGISRHYELPDDEGSGYLIPHLLFGKRYRYGLRAELQGGVTMPLRRARAIYEEAIGGMLALPEARKPQVDGDLQDTARIKGRRFLRHERVLAPHVLVCKSEVDDARRAEDDRLCDQSSREAIVHTATPSGGKADARRNTALVRRIFVAPGVSQNFAELHGVLLSAPAVSGTVLVDGAFPQIEGAAKRPSVSVCVERPLDGLRNISYNYSSGGFPVRSASNEVVYCAPQAPIGKAAGPVTPASQVRDQVLVLQPTNKQTRDEIHLKRAEPYFPDPAADSMVFAVRRRRKFRPQESREDLTRVQRRDYIDGEPTVVSLGHDALQYPNRLAVVLDVVRGGSPNRALSHTAIFQPAEIGLLTNNGFSLAAIGPATLDAGKVAAKRIVAILASGDDFDLDVWCVPSVDQLEKWFDVVESSALIAVARSCVVDVDFEDDAGGANLACRLGIEGLLGGHTDFATFRRRLGKWQYRRPGANECGIGGLPLPSASIRRDIANLVRIQMLRHPIPELGAVQTLRIAHAVSKPNFTPSFMARVGADTSVASPTPNLIATGLEVIRREFKSDEERRDFVEKNDTGSWHRRSVNAVTHQQFATDVLIGGNIQVDLDSAHSATIYAELAHPFTSSFDDPLLGRPRALLGTDLPADQITGGRTNPELYGFTVDLRTGQIAFRPYSVPLVQIEGLVPPDDLSARRIGTESVNVLVDTATGLMRRDLKRYVPSDDKARRMMLTVETKTRFRSEFEYAPLKQAGRSRTISNALDEKSGSDNRWVTSRSSAELADAAKRKVEFWIPSTRRPQPIDPESILPTFVWSIDQPKDRGVVHVERRMLARLRFRRPWFSSGEGEKLGIILWPPKIFSHPPAQTRFNESHISDPTLELELDIPRAKIPQEMAIIMEDQTRGGGYITRAGSDSIRHGGSYEGGDFMPLEAFRDAFAQDGRPARAGRVEKVVMPLPASDSVTGQQAQLHVALLTYEPLFDPIDESWYVDVEIAARDFPDGWVRFGLVRYQEHAIDGCDVSEPATVMVQILPRRRVTLSTRKEADDRYRVTMKVEGVGSLGAADDPSLKSERDKLMMQRPVLRPRLFRRTRPGEAMPEEVKTLWSWEFGNPASPSKEPCYVVPSRGDAGLLWEHTFTLDHDPTPTKLTSYEVTFDEVDLRPAATPLMCAPSQLRPSGPRFAAHIKVPGPAA